MNDPKPANVRTVDIEGQPVRCIEAADGERTWLGASANLRGRVDGLVLYAI
jgi:hypothetical protein